MTISNKLCYLDYVINLLNTKLPLSRLKVKILYRIYADIGKGLSYVRPCYECFKYGRGWPCSCIEIVLVSNRRDVKYSLMHEWGHVYLGDKVDPIFAITVPCKGSEKTLTTLMKDIISHCIEGLTCDTIVDYVVSKHIEEYRKHITNTIKEQIEGLSTIDESSNKPLEEDPLICTQIASLYVTAKALKLTNITTEAIKCFKNFNCTININQLNSIVTALHHEKYLQAYIKLANTLLNKYYGIKVKTVKTTGKDPITNKNINYRCIKLTKLRH